MDEDIGHGGLDEVLRAEAEASEMLQAVLALELAALDGLAELALPPGLRFRPSSETTPTEVLIQLESALFSDIRAFRHLIALGYVAQASIVFRSILVAVGKARACLVDPEFARRIAADERIADAEVLRMHVASMSLPAGGELPPEAVLEITTTQYAATSAIAHKRWSASGYQFELDPDGTVSVSRHPPSMHQGDRGADLVYFAVAFVFELYEQLIPALLEEVGADDVPWRAQAAEYTRLLEELDRRWDRTHAGSARPHLH